MSLYGNSFARARRVLHGVRARGSLRVSSRNNSVASCPSYTAKMLQRSRTRDKRKREKLPGVYKRDCKRNLRLAWFSMRPLQTPAQGGECTKEMRRTPFPICHEKWGKNIFTHIDDNWWLFEISVFCWNCRKFVYDKRDFLDLQILHWCMFN